MADIVISYKREEQQTASALAKALRAKGWTVWWDPKLRAGEHFDDAIEQAIRDAKCVIVLWSKLSTQSEYVKDEANFAKKLGKLVPVAIDNAELPFRFQGLHTVQMRDWDGSTSAAGFRSLVVQLQSRIGFGVSAASSVASPVGSETTASPAAKPKQPIVWDKNSDLSSIFKSAVQYGKVVTPEQCGLDERSILNLHAALQRERDSLDERLALVRLKHKSDWFEDPVELRGEKTSRKPNYGVLTRRDLEPFLPGNKTLAQRASAVLEKLKAAGGDAIDYTPEQLKGLPDNLKARGFALLLNMPERVLNEPGTLRITQQTIDWYTSMHGGLLAGLPGFGETVAGIRPTPKEDIEEVWELAKRLGLQIKVL